MQYRQQTLWTLLAFVALTTALKLENFIKQDEPEIDASVKESLIRRQPRFLFRSTGTTTITATLSTSTACYATVGITALCSRKKKRSVKAISDSPIADAQKADQSPAIVPSKAMSDQDMQEKASKRGHKAMELEKIESSVMPDQMREPRFLLFYTTTFSSVTTTVTTFTATTTFSLTNCLPTSFTYAACG